jgi:hypothetical protein
LILIEKGSADPKGNPAWWLESGLKDLKDDKLSEAFNMLIRRFYLGLKNAGF